MANTADNQDPERTGGRGPAARPGPGAATGAGADRGESFAEAIVHHEQELQTELERVTSLPPAMFDASDPMLETRLAETTESILRCLLELGSHRQPDHDPGDRRLEGVVPAELHALMTEARDHAFDGPEPDLDAGRDAEFAVILADVCSRTYGAAAARAAALLRRDCSDLLHDIDELTAAVADRVRGGFAAADDAGLESLCHRVATAILHSVPAEHDAAPEPGP